jgi:hypothetical protein
MKSSYFKLGNLVINFDKIVSLDAKAKILYLENFSVNLTDEKQASILGAILLSTERPLDMDKAIEVAIKSIDEKKALSQEIDAQLKENEVEQPTQEVKTIKKD